MSIIKRNHVRVGKAPTSLCKLNKVIKKVTLCCVWHLNSHELIVRYWPRDREVHNIPASQLFKGKTINGNKIFYTFFKPASIEISSSWVFPTTSRISSLNWFCQSGCMARSSKVHVMASAVVSWPPKKKVLHSSTTSRDVNVFPDLPSTSWFPCSNRPNRSCWPFFVGDFLRDSMMDNKSLSISFPSLLASKVFLTLKYLPKGTPTYRFVLKSVICKARNLSKTSLALSSFMPKLVLAMISPAVAMISLSTSISGFPEFIRVNHLSIIWFVESTIMFAMSCG